jgi:O-antigen/teichoic acid export membrane protein
VLIVKKIRESHFARQVAVLAGGTAIAHLLTIGTLPLLTRLYTPEEFGVLGIFVAFLSIIGVVANWRYEIAIPLPQSDERAANLATVALAAGLTTTIAVGILVFFVGSHLAGMTKFAGVAEYLWLLPFGIFFTAAYAVFQYWATRRKAFPRIARTRVEQAVGGVSTQLVAGFLGFGTIGLILGQVINNGSGFIGLAWRAYREDRALLPAVRLTEMKSVALEYNRFPKFSVIESLANMSAVQVPLILIGSLAASTEVGFLMLGMRLMQAPVGLIGSSISQVFFSQAVDAHRRDELPELVTKSLSALLKTGVGPLIFAGIVAPSIFGYIFGKEWQRAGELVAWMTPWFVLQFLAQPVSMTLHVTSRQPTALLLQLGGLFLRVGSVLIAGAFVSGMALSESYAVSGALFYFFYIVLIVRAVGLSTIGLLWLMLRSSCIPIAWSLVGLLLTGLFDFFTSTSL